ncbi:MAG: FAD:protein FMN transferase, partial [Halieaceae bacterium]
SAIRGPALVLAFCCVVACSEVDRPVQLAGQVFGTTWSLTYLGAPVDVTGVDVQDSVETAFDIVNESMNHYDKRSLISAFNAQAVDTPMEVDWDFAYVLSAALALGDVTHGAYDVTVSPLSDLWGFGPDGPRQFPAEADIARVLGRVGSNHLAWQPETRILSKTMPGVALDFSSLAKGYAVDLAADALDDLGVVHYMLEIGGEVRVRGQSPRGDAWRIAIERPEPGARGGVQAALVLEDTGVATSGDYRNFFEHEGDRYSHLIDPRTGYPVRHDVVSVTVVHGSAMMADAWATALTVMGSAEAMAMAEARGLAVYVITQAGDRTEGLASRAMKPLLLDGRQ